jgi:hypothetical protein
VVNGIGGVMVGMLAWSAILRGFNLSRVKPRTIQLFNERMMMSALYETNMLTWIIIVLAHCNNSPQIDISLHSDISS